MMHTLALRTLLPLLSLLAASTAAGAENADYRLRLPDHASYRLYQPEAPKMTPEPVAVPKGSSKSEGGKLGKCIPASRIMRAASRVVIA